MTLEIAGMDTEGLAT